MPNTQTNNRLSLTLAVFHTLSSDFTFANNRMENGSNAGLLSLLARVI